MKYNTYGDLSNTHLLIAYGFAYDDNRNDTLKIEVILNDKDEVYAGKKKLLEKFGYGTKIIFNVTYDPIPKKVIEFCRVAVMTVEEYIVYKENSIKTDLSITIERKVLQVIEDRCKGLLNGYTTTLREDEELLREHSKDMTENIRNAIKLRLSEKRLLWHVLYEVALLKAEHYEKSVQPDRIRI